MKKTVLLIIPLLFLFVACEDKPETKDWNDGDSYETIQIGNQIWMAENLKVTHYRNGNEIPNITDNDDWVSLSTGAYCNYRNNQNNSETYGRLYNWYAVNDSRNIAPDGWHVPTDEEIKQLEMYLGMSQSEADDIGWRGTNEGSKLAGRADLWVSDEFAILEHDPEFGASGFNALPAGYRFSAEGYDYDMGYEVYLWSFSIDSVVWARELFYDNSRVHRYSPNNNSKKSGFSVRCVRD